MAKRKNKPKSENEISIPDKANVVLNVILFLMISILIRVWHLSVVQYDDRLKAIQKPQRRTIIERAERGSICDRFNIPLAINKAQYNAAIFYAHIKEIPRITREKSPTGEWQKIYKRKEHINKLSQILAKELELDPERIEDLIYAKAALLPNTPFVIKENISEEQYFRLKALEKDWLGIHAERAPKRYYPQGKTACDVIGYMGAISREKYNSIVNEIGELENYIEQYEQGESINLPDGFSSLSEVEKRLKDLTERSYSINDHVGKSGVEASFDEQLRGFRGKKTFFSDACGNFLKELPGSRPPLSGQRLLVTISSELQEFAEGLLAQNEKIREGRSLHLDISSRSFVALKQPWIKGGAIVAIDPNNGEVIALASYPRFNPNDFVSTNDPQMAKQKQNNIYRWLESEQHLAQLWNRETSLKRETFNVHTGEFHEEQLDLSWKNYLNIILSNDSPVIEALNKIKTIEKAVTLQWNFEALMLLTQHSNGLDLINFLYPEPYNTTYKDKLHIAQKEALKEKLDEYKSEIKDIKTNLDKYLSNIQHNHDKLLVLDLCRLIVDSDRFSPELLSLIGEQTLEDYRNTSTSAIIIEQCTKEMSSDLFHKLQFTPWKKEHSQDFLKEKRQEEKAAKKYHKPYIDLLDKVEKQMFNEFWNTYKWDIITVFLIGNQYLENNENQLLNEYFAYFQEWEKEIKQGAHRAAPWHTAYRTLKQFLKTKPSYLAKEYLQTMRKYEDLNRPLIGKYNQLRSIKGKQLEKHLASAYYPIYGFGYSRSHAFRQAAPQGSIFKIVTAYAALAQQCKKNGSNSNLNPLTIVDQPCKTGGRWIVGYNNKGEAIEQHYKGGRLPRSARRNIGKIDLTSALETSSNPYFSLLAGDILNTPEDLNQAASDLSFGSKTGIDLPGEIPGNLPNDINHNRTGLYSEAIGQHSLIVTPLQTAVMLSAIANGGKIFKPQIAKILAGNEPVRETLHISSSFKPPFLNDTTSCFSEYSNNSTSLSTINIIPQTIRREVFMPFNLRQMLLKGMHRVVAGSRGCANISKIRNYYNNPEAIKAYSSLKNDLTGKTSTAEKIESVTLDIDTGTYIHKHLWFGGIAFDHEEQQSIILSDNFGKPELVVVVYLRYGDFGREAAPPAAQIIKKWREIKKKYEIYD